MVDRIAGFGDQDGISGFDEGQGQVADPLLRTDQPHNLGGGIEGHGEAPKVPVRHSFPEREHAFVGGILMMFGL